jgi:hypothetical protein
MTENQSSNEIRTVCNTGKTRAWRNNVGTAKINGMIVRFGIPGPGGSDLIGLHSMTITPEMVGKRVAVFLAIECKSSTGKPSSDQIAFIEYIQAVGGLAGVARSGEEALNLISNFQPTP